MRYKERSEGELIYAPDTSFLRDDERPWIIFVNARNQWEEKGRTDFVMTCDEIVKMIQDAIDEQIPTNQKLKCPASDSLGLQIPLSAWTVKAVHQLSLKARPEDQLWFLITGEWFKRMKRINDREVYHPEGGRIFEINPDESPLLTKTGVYASLHHFTQGECLQRLGRCPYCKGLFIAPNNRKFKFCPGTNHYNSYHDSTINPEAKSYHREDMRRRRKAVK